MFGAEWQLVHGLHFQLMEPIFPPDDRRPWLLLFLPLAELFICLLAPPRQRGGSETQIPLVWFFSSFDEGLDWVGAWRSFEVVCRF